MTTVHRTPVGSLGICENSHCALLFHLPEMTVEAVAQVPFQVLLPLLNVVQPPAKINRNGAQQWHRTIMQGSRPITQRHRAYDLPAVIYPNGSLEWFIAGQLHRSGGQPAVIRSDGLRVWAREGKTHRVGGLPAVIHGDGTQEWWEYGTRLLDA